MEYELPLSNNPPLAGKMLNVREKYGFAKGKVRGPLRSLRSFLSMTSAFGMTLPTKNTSSDGDFNHDVANNSVVVAAYSNNAVEFLFRHLKLVLYKRFHNGAAPISDLDVVKELFDVYLHGHDDVLDLEGQISGYGGGGLRISARDIARLGLLYLKRGIIDGRCVLGKKFVRDSTSVQVPRTALVSDDFLLDERWNIPDLSVALPFDASRHKDNKRMHGDEGYGHGIWILGDGAFHLSGVNGNYVIVDYVTGLVVSILNDKQEHPNAFDYLQVLRSASTHRTTAGLPM